MKYQRIEQFINFKLNNDSLSRQSAQLFLAQKKYNKLLDQHHNQLIKAKREKQYRDREFNKIQNSTWKQILSINEVVHDVERKKYKFIEKIRQIREQTAERTQRRNQLKRQQRLEEQNLEEELEQTIQEAKYYFDEKSQMMREERQKKQMMRSQIEQKLPIIKNYFDKMVKKENLKRNVEQERKRNQNSTSQFFKATEKLNTLSNKLKKELEEKQKREKASIEQKKNEIEQFIASCNYLFDAKQVDPNPIQKIRQKKEKVENIEYFDLETEMQREKMEELKPFTHETEPHINIDRLRELENSVAEIKQNNNQLSEKQQYLQDRSIALIEQQQKHDKEIIRLKDCLQKIKKDLHNFH